MRVEPTTAEAADSKAAMQAAINAVAGSKEIAQLLELVRTVQAQSEETDTWDTREGHSVEYIMGHLGMALRSAQNNAR